MSCAMIARIILIQTMIEPLYPPVKEVLDVYKKDEFGVPEAFWVIRVESFPAVVTMDSHGQSIHDKVETASKKKLAALIQDNK